MSKLRLIYQKTIELIVVLISIYRLPEIIEAFLALTQEKRPPGEMMAFFANLKKRHDALCAFCVNLRPDIQMVRRGSVNGGKTHRNGAGQRRAQQEIYSGFG
ncbi:hypothetical protein [Cedecea neteri]|uniref:hypothetical protein n=1 Tax=Cedecea neteri TaxID=158822 RepID=UPI0012E00D3D|nr:hypothetical protein [Cedecea neteri]